MDPRVTIQVSNGMQALSNGDILLPVTYGLVPKHTPEDQKKLGKIYNPTQRHPDYLLEVRMFRSSDNGQTWTMFDPGMQKYHKYCWRFGRIVEMDDGRVLMPDKGTYIVSRDFGHTWPEQVMIGQPASETNIIKAADGTWVCLSRNHNVVRRLFKTSFSYDDGQTWTPWRWAGVRGKMPDLLKTQDGWILLAVGAEGLGDGSEVRWYPQRDSFVTIFISIDNGQTWFRDAPIQPVERGGTVIPVDSPVMCSLGDGRVLVIAQAADRWFCSPPEAPVYDHYALIANVIEPIKQGRHWPRKVGPP